MAEINEKDIVTEIANLITNHKSQLISNLNELGYYLPDYSDKTLSLFITQNAGSDIYIAQILGKMIYDINFERKSNIIGIDDIVGGVGAIVGGITGVYSEKEKVKSSKENTKQAELMLEIEKQKTEQAKALAGSQQGTKLSTGAIIGISVGGAVVLTIILVLTFRRRSA